MAPADMVRRRFPLVAFPALPEKLGVGIAVGCRETRPAARRSECLHLFNGFFGLAAAGRAPGSPADDYRCGFPLVAFPALPEKFRGDVAVDDREALSAALGGELVDARGDVLGASLHTGACRAPLSLVGRNVGASLPSVAFPALPEKFGAVAGVGGREALPATGGGELLHLLYGVSFLNAFAGRAPLASADIAGCSLPLVTFPALPAKLGGVIGVGGR